MNLDMCNTNGPSGVTPGSCSGGTGWVGGIFSTTSHIPSTPLPGALPLFIGGLGLIGVAGFRKKRKVSRLAL
jgi:hypothetical protein